MRTVILVAALVGLALAAGGSFVVRAQDRGPAATLEGGCEPGTLPYGVPALVHCKLTARNTGSSIIRNARALIFPTSGVIPDAYYFFDATHDGVPERVDNGQIEYEYGDLAPGTRSTLAVDVIIEAMHPYKAEAWLLPGDASDIQAKADVGADVTLAPPPAGPLAAQLVRDIVSGSAAPSFTLSVHNRGGVPLRDVQIDLAGGDDVELVPAAGWTNGSAPGHSDYAIGAMAPGAAWEQSLRFRPDGACPVAYPAVVVTAGSDDGALAKPVISIGSATIGPCDPSGGNSASALASSTRLPSTGSGATAGGALGRNGVLALAIGVLLIAAGISVRRSHRR